MLVAPSQLKLSQLFDRWNTDALRSDRCRLLFTTEMRCGNITAGGSRLSIRDATEPSIGARFVFASTTVPTFRRWVRSVEDAPDSSSTNSGIAPAADNSIKPLVAMAGQTDWASRMPHRWKESQLKSIRVYRQEERRQAADRKRVRRVSPRRRKHLQCATESHTSPTCHRAPNAVKAGAWPVLV